MKRIMLAGTAVIVMLTAAVTRVHAAEDDVFGYWTEPGGSTIHVERCGDAVCAVLAGVSKAAPSSRDEENPDASLRSRPLCGLRIGSGFHLESPGKLESGSLYDPKTGKTYKGSIEAQGQTLKLRGYVGVKVFGRTETWSRAAEAAATCPNGNRA